MSGKRKEIARVVSQKMIAPDIYDLRLETGMGADALPGSFVGVYTGK